MSTTVGLKHSPSEDKVIIPDDAAPGLLHDSVQHCVNAALTSNQVWDICKRCVTSLAQCPHYNMALPESVEYGIEDVSLDELQTAAHQGCGICMALSVGMTQRIEAEAKASNRALGDMLQSIQVLFKGEKAKQIVIDVTAYGEDDFMIDFDVLGDVHHVTEDNTGQVVPPLGKPNLDVAGPAAFDWLECCITRCRDSCTNCEYDVTNSIYPRRVVQILQHPRSRDDLALVTDFGSAHGEYLTLSYCWGEPHQPQASTTKNLPRRAKGFRSDVLPATLRDAIAVTRRLGFQYLWIDSLCILQDSAKDKKVETRKMKSIFQSSSLTLVAASTGSVSTGFLTERLPAPSIKLGKVPFWTTPNQLSSIELDLVDGDAFRRPDPVHLRAWTLEEWMLPRRRVVFTRGQLFWTCYGFSEVDGGFAAPGIPYSLGNMDVVRVEEENAVINQNPQGDNTEDEADLHEVGSIEGTRGLQLWYDIVGEYTSRDLTDSGDKSAAIDGLAQKIAQRHGFEYAWGLWTEDLARGLCWHHRSYDIDRPDPATLSRSALNPCPSWSWMSINCRCEFIEDYDDLTPLASVRIIPGLEPQELHVEGAALSALNITMPSNLGEAPYILAVETLFDLPKDVQVNLWNPGTHSNMNLWSDTQEVFTVAPEKFRFLFLFEFTAGTWEATLPDAENDYDEYDRAYMNQAAITAGGLLVVPETDGSNRVRRLGYFVMAPAAYTIELLVSKQRSQWILC